MSCAKLSHPVPASGTDKLLSSSRTKMVKVGSIFAEGICGFNRDSTLEGPGSITHVDDIWVGLCSKVHVEEAVMTAYLFKLNTEKTIYCKNVT